MLLVARGYIQEYVMVDYDVDRTVSMLNMRHETLIFQRSFGIFSGVRGGCSSTAEHRIVVPRVAGSKPVSHPMHTSRD